MRPGRKDDEFFIPATLDVVAGRKSISVGKLMIGLLIMFGGLIFAVLLIIFGGMKHKVLYALLLFIGVTLAVRFLFWKEKYFRKQREDLINHKYLYDYNLFWNICEISEGYPTIVTFASGLQGMFVAFDKDIVVGKGPYARYDHHEALSEAYRVMACKKIECIHIDYMDTVGKDERMDGLFKNVNKCDNADIRQVMNMIYNNVQNEMNNSYASYDVYLFLGRNKGMAFWDDMKKVISYFRGANYVREHILNKEEIGDLVESVFNIDDFSVIRANEGVFAGKRDSSFIKVIWKEKDGERTIVNKTTKEKENEARIANAESSLKLRKKKKKVVEHEDNDDDIFKG